MFPYGSIGKPLLRRAFRRAVGLLLASALGAGICAQPVFAQGAFPTIAPNAILIDADTRSVLFEKNADALVTPASTAKLATAEVVFREITEGRLSLDSEFTVSENAWRTGGAVSRGSSMFAALNSRIKVSDLLRGLLVVSGNDAAIVLAEGISGSESAFALKMNARVRELGLKNLEFRNAWGKDDPAQRVTPRDMAFLADHIIRTYPDLYKIFAEKEFLWSRIRQQNRNPLLTMDIGADGLKTGNITEASGYGLVGSAVQNEQRLILAIYGLKNAKERSEEARKILQWGFRSFETKPLIGAGEIVGSARLYGGAQMDVPLSTTGPVRVLTQRGTNERLSAKIVYSGPIAAPVQQGQKIAQLNVYRGSTLALSADLQAAESVESGPLHRRALDAGMELATGLFRKYVLRK